MDLKSVLQCCGYGIVVSMLALYSDDLSLNPTEAYSFFCQMLLEKNENTQKICRGWPLSKSMLQIIVRLQLDLKFYKLYNSTCLKGHRDLLVNATPINQLSLNIFYFKGWGWHAYFVTVHNLCIPDFPSQSSFVNSGNMTNQKISIDWWCISNRSS